MSTPSVVDKAAAAILAAARRNSNITAAGLLDEMERNAVDGWLHLKACAACTSSEWTRAMQIAANELEAA